MNKKMEKLPAAGTGYSEADTAGVREACGGYGVR